MRYFVMIGSRAAEVGVRVLEVVADVREILPGDAQPARVVGSAGAEDQLAGMDRPPAAARLGGDEDRAGAVQRTRDGRRTVAVGGDGEGRQNGCSRLRGADFLRGQDL